MLDLQAPRLAFYLALITFGIQAECFGYSTFSEYCPSLVRAAVRPIRQFDPFKPTVILVDGYSSGRFLPREFRQAGLQVVHFHSSSKLALPMFEATYHRETYDFEFFHDGNLHSAMERLFPFRNIVAILPGTETGITLADELGTYMKARFPWLPANRPDPAHRDKFLMGERLRLAGIDSVLQAKFNNVEAAIRWVRENKLFQKGPKRIVVKPLSSASTDGVTICLSEEELREEFSKQIFKFDELGNFKSELLVQEYLEGPEYVVNTTSLRGHHVATDLWLYHKRLSPDGRHDIYDFDELIPYEGMIQSRLMEYVSKALDALGIESGNGHAEVKWVPGRGPVLVEMNNRMMGAGQPDLTRKATGHSQIDRTALSVADPASFMRLNSGYRIFKAASTVTVANRAEGAKRSYEIEKILRSLPGVIKVSWNQELDERLPLTVDLHTAICDIWILNEDPNVVRMTREKIRQLEESGRFTR